MAEAPRRWLVDGNNVMGSRPDGWWRDRTGAARRLVAEVDAWAARGGERVTMVFDGAPFEVGVAHVEVAWASRAGRDAADDDIAAAVQADAEAGSLIVVTSDAGLAERVRAAGAAVEGAGTFLGRLAAPQSRRS